MADTPIPTLPPKERLILELPVSSGALYGLEMVDRSEGGLKRGTVYVTLGRMEAKSFLSSEQEDPARRGHRPAPPARRRLRGHFGRAPRAGSLFTQELRLEVQT